MITLSSLRGVSGLLSILFLLTFPAAAQQPAVATGPEGESSLDAEGQVPSERGAVYARLLYFEGGISLKREDEEAARDLQLAVNTPLIPGDQIWTGEDGRAEIQLADGSILRLDTSSRLSLLNLVDHEGSFDDTTLIRLMNGRLYVRVENFDPRSRRFQIDTPAGSAFLLSNGLYRLDVANNGVSTVASYRGVAEFLAEDTSVMAHSGERVTTEPGREPGGTRAFNTMRRDSFDLWSESLDDAVAGNDSARGPRPEVPEPVRPYVSELNRYGVWRNDPDYGWIWIPDDVEPDWRPYYYGQWAYEPIGPTWVAYEPWGWAPYHYGRWHWASSFGWFWSPGWVFSGAYVSWSIGPTYFGWCPLGFYDYPVYYGYYYPWVYVPYAHFYDHDVHHHSTGWHDVGRNRFGSDSIVLRSHPTVRPGYGLEQAGKTAYRRSLSNPTYVKNLPGNGSVTRRPTFRDADRANYMKILARRATPETKGAGPRFKAPAGKSGDVGRPTSPAPGIPSRQPAHSASPTGGGRIQPIAARRAGGTASISPATGRPMQPPLRKVPPQRPATSRASGGNQAVGAASPRRAPAAPAHPVPNLEPGRRGTGRVPFVMPKPKQPDGGSKGPAVAPRRAAPPPASRPAPPAKHSAPSKQGGGKKNGDKN